MVFAAPIRALSDRGNDVWLVLLHDAGHNILGIPWWVWLAGGIALAAIAVLAAPELIAFLPEIGEAAAEGAALDAEAAAGALETEGAAAAEGENVYVLGHGPGWLAYEGVEGYNVLNVPYWTPALNDTWIDIGIHENASFLLTSPLGPETLVGQAEFGYQTMYAIEIEQLFSAGYTPLVDAAGSLFMVPP